MMLYNRFLTVTLVDGIFIVMALFSKKDLGLLLPDDVPGDPISLRHTRKKDTPQEDFKPPEPKVDLTKKVYRYRAGKVPQFALNQDVESHEELEKLTVIRSNNRSKVERQRFRAKIVASTSNHQLDASDSQRLCEETQKVDIQTQIERPITTALLDSDSETEESDFEERRANIRKKVLQKRSNSLDCGDDKETKTLQTSPQQHTVTAESLCSSDSEMGTDSDDDDDEESDSPSLMKPVFVPRDARKTHSLQAALDRDYDQQQQKEEEKLASRKKETKKLVGSEVQQKQIEKTDSTESDMPDDTDGVSPDDEYKAWEIRELKRIKRDRDHAMCQEQEKQETLRRRNLTEEERQAEDRKLRKNEPKEKKKWKFLQKYYHKGAFYVDDDSVPKNEDIRKRDTSDATLEDKHNKEILPKVMQVKNFGRAGRTKYTHLVDQDTTGRDSLWTKNDEIRAKYSTKIGGVRNLEDHGAKKRKTE
uniref:Predicted protein putative n=1 Tax=Albugo laibachii Nc14 TaxID=890382 RepID=F0WAE5_9STRA|nr:predicted protein putative [Albugo laibachii Nc14]|eukprot:CCA18116.1 predicted protein putative [Albugo laibachii Nc14]